MEIIKRIGAFFASLFRAGDIRNETDDEYIDRQY